MLPIPWPEPQEAFDAVLPAGAPTRRWTLDMSKAPALTLGCVQLKPEPMFYVIRLPSGALQHWPFERDGEQVKVEAKGRLTLNNAAIAHAAVLDNASIGFLLSSAP